MDIVVLVLASIGSVVIGLWTPSVGGVIAFVVLHFFLFCNVFRIARALELIWATLFVVLGSCTIVFSIPGWIWTFSLSLVGTIAVITAEIRMPSYHGIFWNRFNPHLREWWDDEVVEKDRE